MRPAPVVFLLFVLLSFSFRQDTPGLPGRLRPPADGPLRLSGTFGELRPGHFHTGTDIKAYMGQPLLATAPGFISRIEVKAGGYGRALFISHPGGYTSLYAHMDRFAPEVEQYVKSYQYARESFEIVLVPESSRFPVEPGKVVGYAGLTGRSFGPHLHFELWRSGGGPAANPLLFGLPVADHRPPAIQGLRMYELDEKGTALHSRPFAVHSRSGRYRPAGGDTLYTDSRLTGFSLKAVDLLDGADNLNGIYELQLFVNDTLAGGFRMDSISLEAGGYFNAHIDYAAQMDGAGLFHRCYRMPGDASAMQQPGRGVVALPPGGAARLAFLARDLAGNTARLDCWLKRRPHPATARPFYNYFLPFDEASIIQTAGMAAWFPDSSFYEDVYFNYQSSPEQSDGLYSLVHHLHDNRTPVHGFFHLAIRPGREIPGELMGKAFIAYCNDKHEIVNCGGQWRGGMLHARVRELGDYCIMTDESPPRIEPLGFEENMSGQPAMRFRVTDNIRAGAGTKGLTYRGTINGRWVLFSYDEKNDLLEHAFEKDLPPGRLRLLLEVTDAAGNSAAFEGEFFR